MSWVQKKSQRLVSKTVAEKVSEFSRMRQWYTILNIVENNSIIRQKLVVPNSLCDTTEADILGEITGTETKRSLLEPRSQCDCVNAQGWALRRATSEAVPYVLGEQPSWKRSSELKWTNKQTKNKKAQGERGLVPKVATTCCLKCQFSTKSTRHKKKKETITIH